MIVATTRTRNEEANIEKFCLSYLEYDLADLVLIADGGSDDRTVEIAQSIPGVEVREFTERVIGEKGLWRNPHGKHINFINDWAIEEGADWIIFDDCDCTPNRLLQARGRGILETTQKLYAYAIRIYFWGDEFWFPNLSIDSKKGAEAWMYSLWGWRAISGLRANEEKPWSHEFLYTPKPEEYQKFEPPMALLHRPWPTEEVTNKKLKFYRDSGQHPTMFHPTDFGGHMEPIKEWMA
jgi:glycosyltransferase involved in cell wall biosynthesis